MPVGVRLNDRSMGMDNEGGDLCGSQRSGTRVLRGAEWELIRVGLSTLWDDIESQPDDEEAGHDGSERPSIASPGRSDSRFWLK